MEQPTDYASTDLFANLTVVLLLVLSLTMAQDEALTVMDNTIDSPQQQNTLSLDKQALSLLEISKKANGSTQFHWKPSKDKKKQLLTSIKEVRKAIADARPDGVRLRIDNKIDFGIYRKIYTPAADAGVIFYLSDRQE